MDHVINIDDNNWHLNSRLYFTNDFPVEHHIKFCETNNPNVRKKKLKQRDKISNGSARVQF